MLDFYGFVYKPLARKKLINPSIFYRSGQEERRISIAYSLYTMVLKPLIPSLREKKRYIAFEVKADHAVAFHDAKKQIEQSMHTFLGDLGMAKAGVIFLKDWKNNRGIFKVNTKHVDEAKAALALVQTINSTKAIVQSVGVSGSLDKMRSSYL